MDHRLISVINALCDDVGTPLASFVKTLVKKGEWKELLKLRVQPHGAPDSEAYFRDALVVDLLRKSQFQVPGVDRAKAARDTFWACEAQCASTNARLSRFLPERLLIETPEDDRVLGFINLWRKNVSKVLGRVPDSLTPRFSGGSTFADKGVLITTPDKMSSTPTITSSARCLLPFWNETLWAKGLLSERPWASDPRIVRGNRFTTVPKDGIKDRGICVEPSVNITLQLDVGTYMKQRIRGVCGVNLYDGQDLHRELARAASKSGHLATIDLSNASDTVCRVLPKLLLSEPWFELLNSLRAPFTRVGKKWVRLEKFSSMGNGFTFELETLLYYTLAQTVCEVEGIDGSTISCYGDDIIVPTAAASTLMNALRYFGFEPNREKTFVKGRFRESCGGDFFDGVPVRAHFIKELPDEPQDWISLANGLRRVAGPDVHDGSRWSYVRRAWLRALDCIPSDIRRCRGPEHLGDVVIHDSPEFWTLTERKPKSARGSIVRDGAPYVAVRAYVPIPQVLPWKHWTPAVQLACCTLGLPSPGVTPRGGVSGYTFRWIACEQSSKWEPTYLR